MSDAPLNKHLPRQVDPRKFAQKGVGLSGQIPLASLARLSEAVAGGVDEITADLTFGVNEQGCKVMTGHAEAEVYVVCQRCLENTQLRLSADISLGIVWNEDQASNLSKDLEPWILDEGPADLYSAVEEELLLSLPMVAYHKENCIDASLLKSGEEPEEEPEELSNPFKVLEQLKGSPK